MPTIQVTKNASTHTCSPSLPHTHARAHTHTRARAHTHTHTYTQRDCRTIQDWNNLPQSTVEATTIDTFMSRASKPATQGFFFFPQCQPPFQKRQNNQLVDCGCCNGRRRRLDTRKQKQTAFSQCRKELHVILSNQSYTPA